MQLEFDLIHTILLAMVVLFAGRALVAKIGVLQRFSIPAPVVGGGLVAILLAFADGIAGLKISLNMALMDSLLLMFFTTVGLAADARMLAKGGVKLLVFLAISAAHQNFTREPSMKKLMSSRLTPDRSRVCNL